MNRLFNIINWTVQGLCTVLMVGVLATLANQDIEPLAHLAVVLLCAVVVAGGAAVVLYLTIE